MAAQPEILLDTRFGIMIYADGLCHQVNPRRPYDDDYNLFLQLLSRQLATSLASVVLFEEEIRRGQKAAKMAALDRIELSEQLAARTQEVSLQYPRVLAPVLPSGLVYPIVELLISKC